jgi:lysozyme family protein
MLTSYDEALKHVLVYEGGYSNNPRDPGGPTNRGITLATAREFWNPKATAVDVKAMPLGVAADIYQHEYWNALSCSALPAGLDMSVFDYAVNSGVGRAGKVLCSLVGMPGSRVGPTVLAEVAKRPTNALILSMNTERLSFLRSLPTWHEFGSGWQRRVTAVESFSFQLLAHASISHGGAVIEPPRAFADVDPAPGKGIHPTGASQMIASAAAAVGVAAGAISAATLHPIAAVASGVFAAAGVMAAHLAALARDAKQVRVSVEIVPPAVAAPVPVPTVHFDTRWVQLALNMVDKANLDVDGAYGAKTAAAVVKFQRAHGLYVDGKAGTETCIALDAALHRVTA